jgi:tetratricopeptide (TPR) repeat protein
VKRNLITGKQAISIGLLMVLAGLMGCATTQKPSQPDETLPAFSDSQQSLGDDASSDANMVSKAQVGAKSGEVNKQENTATQEATITPEAFYYLLSGEIAGQRQRFNLSADSYIKAAQLTQSPQVAARAAQIAIYAKDYAAALDAATVWTNVEPDNITARKLIAGLQLKQGETDQAISNYVHVLSASGVDFEQSAIQIAGSVSANTTQPYPIIDALSNHFPGTAELPFAYAVVAARQKDFEIAESKLDQALAIRPDWDSALLMKTKLVAQSGDTAKASKMLADATRQFPDNAEIHTLYAKLLAMQHDYPKSIKHFKRVVDLDPGNADAGFSLAIIQSTLGDFDAAREGLLELAKNPSHRQRAYLQLGQLAAENKLPDEALAWLDQVDSGALAYDAQIYASEILLEQKDVEGALNRLSKLRNLYPQLSTRIALREAEIHSQNKQLEEAIEVLNGAIETDLGSKQLFYMRSLLADQVGRYELAESDLKAVLALEPDSVNALNALGYILCNRTERLQEAEQYLLRAIKIKPDDPAIMDSMGWLRFRQHNYEAALKYLQAAYQQNNDVEIGAHLAEIFWALDRREEARLVLQEVWGKDSDHDALMQMRQRLPQAFLGIVSN